MIPGTRSSAYDENATSSPSALIDRGVEWWSSEVVRSPAGVETSATSPLERSQRYTSSALLVSVAPATRLLDRERKRTRPPSSLSATGSAEWFPAVLGNPAACETSVTVPLAASQRKASLPALASLPATR